MGRFATDVWMDGTDPLSWPLIPFSAGPATCPGRELVLLLTSAFIGRLVGGRRLALKPSVVLDPDRPLTLNDYAMRRPGLS